MEEKNDEESRRRKGQSKSRQNEPKVEAITTINELEDALCKAAGTTTKQVEAAKISILKHQLEVPLNLCGKRLTLSHKRQKRYPRIL